jgi:lipopolysaccharide transport system permease protein
MSPGAGDPACPPPSSAGRVIIQPDTSPLSTQLRELWAHRELLYFLALRDLKVRYKQTILGAAWAVLQPLMTMIVFSVFFGYLARMPSDGIPYPVFTYAALLPWSLFSHALSESSNSLVNSQALLTKVFFPRLIIPVAPLLVGLVDFGIAFVVLVGMLLAYGLAPGPAIVTVPLFMLLALATALAAGVWLSALNVQYRDVRYTIPFLTQLWLFATPVAYPSSLLSEPWRSLYGLNPMAGVVEGFRWALIGRVPPPGMLLAVSVAIVLLWLFTGLVYFSRMERSFADVV